MTREQQYRISGLMLAVVVGYAGYKKFGGWGLLGGVLIGGALNGILYAVFAASPYATPGKPVAGAAAPRLGVAV